MNALVWRCCCHVRSVPSRHHAHRALARNSWTPRCRPCPSTQPWAARRKLSTSVDPTPGASDQLASESSQALPWSCPGCGAYSQTAHPDAPGYFSLTRKPVKAFLAARDVSTSDEPLPGEDLPAVYETTDALSSAPAADPTRAPVCDRCHSLLHHNKGAPIEHPTLQALQAIFDETPHRYNHVYQIIDAADFPMSLIPRLHEKLDLSPQRSQNRRAKHAKFLRGRVAEISYIVTRSDLLAPKKEQVDSLMPALVQILRDALGRAGRNVRLGNVRCVSAHRGWWTKEVKEDIWQRGGGGWMVGKVNVGKSNLIETILPKGRLLEAGVKTAAGNSTQPPENRDEVEDGDYVEAEANLLPPRPKDVRFPVLPVVSHLSGTTAGPIRIPFGSSKGELIDLPGLARGGLEDLVEDQHREALVMRSRVKAEQLTIKPGQSMVISNLIRITPKTEDLIFLASPFLKLDCHVTHTDKAVEILAQQRNHVVRGIAKSETADKIASAGTFKLRWDVTRQRAGPLTARDAADLDPSRLPFVVFSMDLLIESVGWVEIVAQMRRRQVEEIMARPDFVDGDQFPEIEVFSPHGKHIGQRQTLNLWLMGGQRPLPVSRRKAKPRMSMKGQKKAMKRERRTREAAQREFEQAV